MKFLKSLFLLVLTSSIFNTMSQGGAIDNTFNIVDNGDFGNGLEFDASVYDTKLQSNGKIIVGGAFKLFNGYQANKIVRLNNDGSIDNSFSSPFGSNGYVTEMFVLNDGRIIVSGFLCIGEGSPVNQLLVLNQFGQIDNQFELVLPNSQIETIAVQSDNKILIGGNFTEINGVTQNKIARLLANGTLDNDFNIGTGFNAGINKIYVQNDGKILIGGNFDLYNGTFSNKITRLNIDGTIDLSWTNANNVLNSISDINLQSDNKIIITGNFYSNPNSTGPVLNKVARLTSDGLIDPSFNQGTGFDNSVHNIIVLNDDKLILNGTFTSYNGSQKNRIIRLLSDGIADSTFQIGNGFDGPVLKSIIQPDLKIVCIGGFQKYNENNRYNIVRINFDGSIDSTFCPGVSFEGGTVYSIIELPDQKLVVGGRFTTYNNFVSNNLIQLNNDGTIDSGFNIGKGFDNIVYCVQRQIDGKLLVGGLFEKFNDSISPRIVRLHPDGKIDTSFHVGSGFNIGYSSFLPCVNVIRIQSDGKILVGGNFTSYNQQQNQFLIRLNSDGSIDNAFSMNSILGDQVKSIKILDNNKILIGGNFSFYNPVNNQSFRGLFRLNEDGSLDSTFNHLQGIIHSVECVELQPDNKILIGGYFSSIFGISRGNIARLNSDGTLDTTFAFNSGFESQVNEIKYLSNNTVLVGGNFTLYNNLSVKYFASLDSIGSIDSSFYLGSSFDNFVECIFIQSDEKMMVGGYFEKYQNRSKVKIARLSNCSTVSYQNDYYCGSYLFEGNEYFVDSNFVQYTSNYQGCDSLIVHNFKNAKDSIYESRIECGSYTWSVNNQTYTHTGIYIEHFSNIHNCDSVRVINLTIIPDDSAEILNTFVLPSDEQSCNGQLILNYTNTYPVIINTNNGSYSTLDHYFEINNLCPGISNLEIIAGCGDTTFLTYVVPSMNNFIFNNNYIDSSAIDSLGVITTSCIIDYGTLDSAYIDSVWFNAGIANVIWNVVDASGSHIDTVTYQLNGTGVYWLELSVYCPFRAVGDYFSVIEAIYYNENEGNGITTNSIEGLSIIPNPSNNFVVVKGNFQSSLITITDLSGKKLDQLQILNGDKISLDKIDSGTYIFEITTEKGSDRLRIVKN